MSSSDDKPPRGPGRRKDGKPYKEGNTRDDGSFNIGKNRTPVPTRFSVGDGRPRGRRPKGERNDDTEFELELSRKIKIREDGKERTVSKAHAINLRLIDNATRKGENKAIEMIDQRRRRISADKEETSRRYHTLHDLEILERYLRERQDELNMDPLLFGDPEPRGDAGHEGEGSDG